MKMRSDNQFAQLMLQYTQLKNGAEEIRKLLKKNDYDSAISMITMREQVFISCKNIRNYLELMPEQELELNILLDEIRKLELENINFLKTGMAKIKSELKNIQQTRKMQNAYDFDEDYKGNIINYLE